MKLPNNHLKFPDNVEEPMETEINDHYYMVHGFKFHGVQELYEFLKQNPQINYEVWNRTNLSSITNSFRFAGEPYKKAVEKLISEMDPGYQEFLTIQKRIKAKSGLTHSYKQIKSIAGGTIDPVAYTTGSPEIYRVSRIQKRPKYITIDTQVAYRWDTNKAQVFNRAVILTNLIRALEKNGYIVSVNAFMVVCEYDEVIKAVFEIKQQGKSVNYQSLYKSLVDVEFFRRICFRLIELSNVESRYWSDGYGVTSGESFVRSLLRLKKEDIYFDQPGEMGIQGYDIGSDFEEVISRLNLEDVIDVEREKKILTDSVRVLKK